MGEHQPCLSSPGQGELASAKLDLTTLPPVFVSATHIEIDDLHELEEALVDANAPLTYDIHEARIVLSKVTKKARIQFDLRAKGLWTTPVELHGNGSKPTAPTGRRGESLSSQHWPKKRKLGDAEKGVGGEKADEAIVVIIDDDSSTASVDEGESGTQTKPRKPSPVPPEEGDLVKVIRIEWFEHSKSAGKILPLDDYLGYQGRRIEKPAAPTTPSNPKPAASLKNTTSPTSKAILARAKEDAPSPSPKSRLDRFGKRRFQNASSSKSTVAASWAAGGQRSQLPHLLHATTSEHEEGSSSDLLEMPAWVQQGAKYACQRSTPFQNANEEFIALLKKIRTARLLTNDEIGVRAYSTSIASLAAYPYPLTSAREIVRLPGCEAKIAKLWVEWKNTGRIQAVEDVEADEEMMVLRLFFEIWGVGATTAREFFYERGWRDLDDIVEFGWSTLSRVQQIGVKFYDEFLDLIPRAEVEEIGRIVHRHAVQVRDDDVQSLIVGGYRRGKEACGDVDLIVSHPDEAQTENLVNDVVASLEEEGWITHTLLLSLKNTHRGQQTLPFRTGGGGHGFDSLDKALVVWQDPTWPGKSADMAADPEKHAKKNPNIHRRVDIIISPWRTVGCAVTGWSGGTTFQRDLRRYAKNVKGWKFDSSGVRSRVNGEVVDVEGWNGYGGGIGKGRASAMEEAERRVFEGMGLVYREAGERCTG